MPALHAPEYLTSELRWLHDAHANARQDESADTEFLVTHGHPFANEYRPARSYFDHLTHRAGPLERLAAYIDPGHQVLYSAPAIDVTWNLTGEWRARFGATVLPGSPDRRTFLQAAAEAGFPPETGPNGHLGWFQISCRDKNAAGRLRASLAERGVLNWHPVDGKVSLRAFRLDRFLAITEALQSAIPTWMLRPRSQMDIRPTTILIDPTTPPHAKALVPATSNSSSDDPAPYRATDVESERPQLALF